MTTSPPNQLCFVFGSLEDTDGIAPPSWHGAHQRPRESVASYLCPLYADVRDIPMTHNNNDAGLVPAASQWIASRVKDVVRGIQEMPDVGKGLQLLELLASCDPEEEKDWATSADIHEKICIVGVKNRWRTPTSGGWSDALITFYFADDATKHICEVQLVHENMMTVRKEHGAHEGYTVFRCALELLEATGHADIIDDIESLERHKITATAAAAAAAKRSAPLVHRGFRSRSLHDHHNDSSQFGAVFIPVHRLGSEDIGTADRDLSSSMLSLLSRQTTSSAEGDGYEGGLPPHLVAARGEAAAVAELELQLEKLEGTVATQSKLIAAQAAEIARLQEDQAMHVSLAEQQVELVEDAQRHASVQSARFDRKIAAVEEQVAQQAAMLSALMERL